MTKEELIAGFKKIWDARVIVVGTALVVGILDLIGITTWDLGIGFILGFLGFVGILIAKMVKK